MAAIIDLFAGAGGWDEGAHLLGIDDDILGIELNEVACQTAEAAGHARLCTDLTQVDIAALGQFDGLIASPPCQAWSTAGLQLGRYDKASILEHIWAIRDAGHWLPYHELEWRDLRSPLVLEPLRYALQGKPRWIAMEQVPAVLSLWDEFAVMLRRVGYACATAILSAEQYGVPQTRKRAILVARRIDDLDQAVAMVPNALLPKPAFAAHGRRQQHPFAESLPRPRSMADEIGWGSDTPFSTVTGALGAFGSSSARSEFFMRHQHSASWRQKEEARREATDPAFAITGKSAALTWDNCITKSGINAELSAALQTFPADYPWQGTKGQKQLQIGNAVPPRFAAAILAGLLDLEWTSPPPGEISADLIDDDDDSIFEWDEALS